MNGKLIVIDTSGFFAPAECLNGINPAQGEETKVSLVTLDLMIFEFLKVIEQEEDRARSEGNLRRVKVLQNLKARFSGLLREFDIQIKNRRLFHCRRCGRG